MVKKVFPIRVIRLNPRNPGSKFSIRVLGPHELNVLQLRRFDMDVEVKSGDRGTRRPVRKVHRPAMEIAVDVNLRTTIFLFSRS